MSHDEIASAAVVLPTYKATVDRFHQALLEHLRSAARGDGVLSEIKAHVVHEGAASRILRKDGPEEIQIHEASGELELKYAEINRFDVQAVLNAVRTIAGQLAGSQTKHLFETLNAVTAKTGNVVQGQNRAMDHEMMFEALEKLEQNFSGGPGSSDLFMVIHPNMIPRIKQLEEEFQNSAELQRRHKEQMVRKYEQFRSREMDRIMVG
jgi:hypothetical protein